MKKFFLHPVVFITISVLFIPIANARAAVWQPQKIFSLESWGFEVLDSYATSGERASYLIKSNLGSGANRKEEICTEFGKKSCSEDAYSYLATAILPICSDDIIAWCVESLKVYKKDSTKKSASYLRSVDAPTFAKNERFGLPPGGAISLWDVDGEPHKGGESTYAVSVVVTATLAPKSNAFTIESVRGSVLPYSDLLKPFERLSASVIENGEGGTQIGRNGGGNAEQPNQGFLCIFVEKNLCGNQEDFFPEQRVELTIRLGKSVTGWLMGRLGTPEIQVIPISKEQNRLIIDGQNLSVARLYVNSPDKNLWESLPPRPVNASGVISSLASDSNTMKRIAAWRDFAKDTSSGTVSSWSFSTISGGIGSPCLTDTSKLLGLVTTNAMAYEGTAPNFQNGTLDYQVAGMHYLPDGITPFEGSYDLSMRSETARCLYGFSSAPIQATISITGEQNQKIAVTKVSEEEGWLKLSATGFTFSSPTISVKLFQEKANLNQEKEFRTKKLQGAKLESMKAKSITCVKGKTVKKVTGVNPKCPTGFNKK